MPPKPKRRREPGQNSSDILHYNGQVELTFKHKPCRNVNNSSSDEELIISSKPKLLSKLDDCSSDSDDEIQIFTPSNARVNDRENNDTITMKQVIIDRPITPPPADEIAYNVIRKKTRDIAKNVNDKLRSLQQVTLEQVHTPPQSSSYARISDSILIDSPSSQEDNRSFTLRIRTQNGIERFRMTMNEKFDGVIERLAKKNNVPIATISLSFTDSSGVFHMLKGTESPNMVDLNCADIIDCVIIHAAEMSEESTGDEDDYVNIKLQGCDAKLVKSFKVMKEKPLSEIMKEYALFCDVRLTKLKFYFDGDVINGEDSPSSLDMDDDDVIDVKII